MALCWVLWGVFLAFLNRNWWYASSLLALFWIGTPDPGVGSGMLISVINVNAFSDEENLLQQELQQLNSDVLVEIERRTLEVPLMHRAAHDETLPNIRPSHLSVVFCKEECSAAVTGQIGSESMAMPIAMVRIDERICLLGIHAPPPLPVDASGMTPYIDYLEERIQKGSLIQDWKVCKKGDGILLMGDLNAVAGSQPYRRLLSMGLKDIRKRTGIWGSTWPIEGFYLPFPVFRLDHIMVGPSIEIQSWRSIRISNSDHLGLQVWI